MAKEKTTTNSKGGLGSIISTMKDVNFKPVNTKDFEKVEFISTGSIILDHIIKPTGGGIPRGVIVELYGAESSGKSSMALSTISENQKMGNPNIYFDRERAFDPTHASTIGINIKDEDTFIVSNADTWEDIYTSIYEIGTQVENCIFVVDSVNAVKKVKSSDKEEVDFSDYQDMGKVSKFLSVETPKLLDMLKDNNNTLIFINQIRDKIVTGFNPAAKFGPQTTTAGGWAIKFYASLRIEFKQTMKEQISIKNYLGKEEKVAVAHWIKATIKKSKVSAPFRSGEFLFRFDSGIDNLFSVIKIAEAKKVITRSGAMYYIDEHKCKGFNELRTLIEKDNSLRNKLYSIFEKEDLFAIPSLDKSEDDDVVETVSDFSDDGGVVNLEDFEE